MINDDLLEMNLTVYTIEMAYARMHELRELADRSRAHHTARDSSAQSRRARLRATRAKNR